MIAIIITAISSPIMNDFNACLIFFLRSKRYQMQTENQREERTKKVQAAIPTFSMNDPEKTTLPISFTLTSDSLEEARTNKILENMRQLQANAHGGSGPMKFEFGDVDAMGEQNSSLMSYHVESILRKSREFQEMLKKASEERQSNFNNYDEAHINPLAIPSTNLGCRQNPRK